MLRSELTDTRTQPIQNMATNPNFERAISGATIVRRNFVLNPILSTSIHANGGNVGSGSKTATRTIGRDGRGAARQTATADGANPGWGMMTGTLTPGTYVISVYGRSNNASLILRAYRQGTATATTSHIGDKSATSEWQRVHAVVTITSAGTLQVSGLVVSIGSVAAGDWVEWCDFMCERIPSLLPFFAPGIIDNKSISYEWEGAADASTSVAKSSVIELRRNLHVNPIPSATITQYSVANGATATYSSTKQAVEVVPNAGDNQSGITLMAQPFSATTPFTVSVELESESGGNYMITGTVGVAGSNGQTAFTAGEVKRIRYTGTATATGGSFYAIRFGSDTGRFWVRKVLVESATTMLPYFDGETTYDADFNPTWTGTANLSASVLRGIQPQGYFGTGGSGPRCILTQSLDGSWARLVPIPFATNNDSPMSLGGDTGAMRLGMVAGQTYTALATCKLLAAQTGSLSNAARSIVAYYRRPTTGYVTNYSSQPANIPGETILRLTFSIPSDATEAFIRLFNGALGGGGDVYWGKVALMEGVYTGPYLDGDMPGCVWRGTPHASTSAGYARSI